MSDYPGPEVWHEAGHALAALHYGGQVRLVTMESDPDDHAGHTEVLWRGWRGIADSLERSALVALAGPVAETLFVGEEIEDPEVLSSWRADWDEAMECIEALGLDPGEDTRMRDRMIAELVAYFRDERVWELLARMADALDAYQTLDETMIEDTLG